MQLLVVANLLVMSSLSRACWSLAMSAPFKANGMAVVGTGWPLTVAMIIRRHRRENDAGFRIVEEAVLVCVIEEVSAISIPKWRLVAMALLPAMGHRFRDGDITPACHIWGQQGVALGILWPDIVAVLIERWCKLLIGPMSQCCITKLLVAARVFIIVSCGRNLLVILRILRSK